MRRKSTICRYFGKKKFIDKTIKKNCRFTNLNIKSVVGGLTFYVAISAGTFFFTAERLIQLRSRGRPISFRRYRDSRVYF